MLTEVVENRITGGRALLAAVAPAAACEYKPYPSIAGAPPAQPPEAGGPGGDDDAGEGGSGEILGGGECGDDLRFTWTIRKEETKKMTHRIRMQGVT